MRVIGQLENEPSARLFSDWLRVQGIDHEIDPEDPGVWKIWVRADEQIGAAQALLRSYCENPGDPKYCAAARTARTQAEQREKEQATADHRFHDRKRIFADGVPFGALTVGLIYASLAVAILTGLGGDPAQSPVCLQKLSITEYQVSGGYIHWLPGLPEIRHGQVWRLFTPMFIHFGALHIFFNMVNFYFLGAALERRQGTGILAALILVIAGLSNLGQYLVASSPAFGGMSGVVYGLFGYIWIRNRFDARFDLELNPQSVLMMVAWFFLCLFGVIPNVANTAHGVGFAVGAAWGFLSAQIANRRAG